MRELREKPAVHEAIERAATDEKSKGFAPVLATIKDYDEDRPGQRLEVTVMSPEDRTNRLAAVLAAARDRAQSTNGSRG